MKFYLKALFFLLAITTMLTLTACGGGSDDNGESESLVGTWYLFEVVAEEKSYSVIPNSNNDTCSYTFKDDGSCTCIDFETSESSDELIIRISEGEGDIYHGKWTASNGKLTVIDEESGESGTLDYSLSQGILSITVIDEDTGAKSIDKYKKKS